MYSLIIFAALCGHPTPYEVPAVCPPTTVETAAVDRPRRHPVVRVGKAAIRVVIFVRPFHRRGRCR